MLEVVTRFKRTWKWKWSLRRNNTTGSYLPYNTPQMQAKFNMMVETQGVHPRLILKDQVWAMQYSYSSPAKTLWKDRVYCVYIYVYYDVEVLYVCKCIYT